MSDKVTSSRLHYKVNDSSA